MNSILILCLVVLFFQVANLTF